MNNFPSENFKPRVDRLGQAVVSFIFSILSLFLLLLFFVAFDRFASYRGYYDEPPYGVIVLFFITLAFTLVGFVLGIRARNSASGRGLAIAAITISSIPLGILGIMVVFLLASFIKYTF